MTLNGLMTDLGLYGLVWDFYAGHLLGLAVILNT